MSVGEPKDTLSSKNISDWKRAQGEQLVDEKKKAIETAKTAGRNMILSIALADGKISNAELEILAKIDFTADDVKNILNRSEGKIANLNLSDAEKQKLVDSLMIRLEAYQALNEETKGQETQFGV